MSEEEDKPYFSDAFFRELKRIEIGNILGEYLGTAKATYHRKLRWVDSKNFSQPIHRNDNGERVYSYDVIAAADLTPGLEEDADSHVVLDIKIQAQEGRRYPTYSFGYSIQFFSKPKKLVKPDDLVGVCEDYDHSSFELTFLYREAKEEHEKHLVRPTKELVTRQRLEDHVRRIGEDVVRILGTLTTVGLLASSQHQRYVYYFSDPVEEGEEEGEEESLS